jgi:hypothetical protein
MRQFRMDHPPLSSGILLNIADFTSTVLSPDGHWPIDVLSL